MTMAAAIESRTAASAWSNASRIVSVDIVGDLAQAETIWRRLEEQQHFSTPYQRFDFLAPWQRLVGERERLRPFIVMAMTSRGGRYLCFRPPSGKRTAFASRFSWVASTPLSTWRCGTGILPPTRPALISTR